MKKLLVMIVLLGVVAAASAVDVAGQEVTTTVDVTYATKYIWRGFNLYGSHGAIQPSVDLAFANGFSANVWASYPVGSGSVAGTGINDLEEFDYTLAYSNSIMEDVYQTDYTIGWRYYDFIDMSSDAADMQEIFVEAAMPNIVGNGFTPHAAYYQMWNAKSGGAVSGAAGAIFVMGFGYDFTLEQAPDLPMTFTWDVVYNDGTGVADIDHDWSHQLFGLSTTMECPYTGGSVTPAIYWQNSWEDDVDDSNELFATLSYSIAF